jgi:hypothetical protein
MVTRQSTPQRITTTAKISVRALPSRTAVAIGWTRSPRRGSASASSSFDVESDREFPVVASLGACRFEPGGEAGGSAAPEELDPELESDRAGPVEVPVGSFVLLEASVSESAAASEGTAPKASVGVAEGSVALAPSVVSVAPVAGAHVFVVSAAAAKVSVVVAEVSVASGTEAHVLVVSAAAVESPVVVAELSVASGAVTHVSVVSAAAAEVSVVVAEVSVASGAVAHVLVVSAAAAESSVVVAEVSVASGAVTHVSVVSAAAAESSVVVAEVSVASGAVTHVSVASAVPELSVFVAEVSEVPSDDAVEVASLGIESDDVAEASETDGGGSSARAVAANRDAQRRAASTATVQPTNPRLRRRSKQDDCMPGTATELPSISAASRSLRSFSEFRVSHLTSGAQGCDANRRAERQDDPPVGT